MSASAPVLFVVPPSPHVSQSNAGKAAINGGIHYANGTSKERPGLSTADSLDTVASSPTSTSTTTGKLGRNSSEKTAVNIYSMYGGRDSVAMTNATGYNSVDLGTRYSMASSEAYETPAESLQEHIRTKTPTPVPNGNMNEYTFPNGGDQGQIVTSSGRNSPAIIINPPPRRSSRQSLHSNKNSISKAQNLNDQPSSRPSSSKGHGQSSRPSSAQRPSVSLSHTPTPLSSEPSTSRTSSSAPTIPIHSLPQQPTVLTPLAPMAPSPGPNEDPDSYYIRATYAALDVSGVRGDGYEDGQELTRARLGSGKGVLPSPFAPTPDTAEKLRREMDETRKNGELGEKEKELLQMLDRYGFFSPPSENRIVLLKAAPLKTKLAPYKVSTSSVSPNATQLQAQPAVQESADERQREDRRIAKWGRMLVPVVRDSGANVIRWGWETRKERKLEERVYKGIPDRWRTAAWFTLIEGKAKDASKKTGKEVKRTEMLNIEYRDSIDLPSTFDIQIDLDVPRTISGHVLFKTRYGMGQRSMFHVLHSFSLHCSICGYCQGMGPLAATLLCYLDPEKVYSCLVRLHDNYDMHETFLPGFPGLLEAFYVQERIMQRMIPGVYDVFKKNMISTTAYAVKWYITLFANTVTFQTQLRLWDVYFLEGKDVMILMSVAIIWIFKDHFLSAQASFETILELLSSFFVVEDEDALLRWLNKAMEDRRLRRDMDRWREEWKELVKSGKDRDALL